MNIQLHQKIGVCLLLLGGLSMPHVTPAMDRADNKQEIESQKKAGPSYWKYYIAAPIVAFGGYFGFKKLQRPPKYTGKYQPVTDYYYDHCDRLTKEGHHWENGIQVPNEKPNEVSEPTERKSSRTNSLTSDSSPSSLLLSFPISPISPASKTASSQVTSGLDLDVFIPERSEQSLAQSETKNHKRLVTRSGNRQAKVILDGSRGTLYDKDNNNAEYMISKGSKFTRYYLETDQVQSRSSATFCVWRSKKDSSTWYCPADALIQGQDIELSSSMD